MMDNLKAHGCGIVYISYKMKEIFQLCDEITILRDGQWIATHPVEGLSMDQIIAMMAGCLLSQCFPDCISAPGEVMLEVCNLTSLRQPSIRDISFNLRYGEIISIAGLIGARRTILLKRYSVFVKSPPVLSVCTTKLSKIVAPTRLSATVSR